MKTLVILSYICFSIEAFGVGERNFIEEFSRIQQDLERAVDLIAKGSKMAKQPDTYSAVANFGRGGVRNNSSVRAQGEALLSEGNSLQLIAQKRMDALLNEKDRIKQWMIDNGKFMILKSVQGSRVNAAIIGQNEMFVHIVHENGNIQKVARDLLSKETNELIDIEFTFGVKWEPFVVFDNNIFPGLIASGSAWKKIDINPLIYSKLDNIKPLIQHADGIRCDYTMRPRTHIIDNSSDGFIGIYFKKVKDRIEEGRITFEVKSSNGYFKSLPITIDLDFSEYNQKEVGSILVFPQVIWDKKIFKNNSNINDFAEFKIAIGDQVFQNSKRITIRPLNDVIYGGLDLAYKEEDNDRNQIYEALFQREMKGNLASYVNEKHPKIESIKKIIREEYNYIIEGLPPKTLLDAFYAWNYLKSQGITYNNDVNTGKEELRNISINKTPLKYYSVTSQRVRSIDQILSNKSANCLDGTLMLASVLQNFGYDCSIVLQPGHAYLLLGIEKGGKNFRIPIETTRLGNNSLVELDAHEMLENHIVINTINKLGDFKKYQGLKENDHIPDLSDLKLLFDNFIIKDWYNCNIPEEAFSYALYIGLTGFIQNAAGYLKETKFDQILNNNDSIFETLGKAIDEKDPIAIQEYQIIINILEKLGENTTVNINNARKNGYDIIEDF